MLVSGLERYIDLGTDARTAPTPRMWKAMQEVALYRMPFVEGGEGPLEALLAQACEMTGQPAALLLPSCTMANLIAMMAHAERGDQVLLEERSHIAWSEGWGIASIAGLYPRLLPGPGGAIPLEAVIAVIEQSVFSHQPRTRLICLENTHNASGGAVLPLAYTQALCAEMKERGIAVHLDGARIFNAAVALNESVRQLSAPFDSVAMNLNKGLSALEGAVLCGSQPFIRKALQLAQALGGNSQHKAGIIAACGLIALDEGMAFIAGDHRRAQAFALAASRIPGVAIDAGAVQTNIVMADVSGTGLQAGEVLRRLRRRGVNAYVYNEEILRFVFHRHIDDTAGELAAQLLAAAARTTD